MDDTNGVSKISLLRGGILIQSNFHQQLDQYFISDVSVSLAAYRLMFMLTKL